MKIDTAKTLLNLKGEPLRDFNIEAFGAELLKAGVDKKILDDAFAATRKDVTFASVAVNALMGSYEDEKSLSGKEKFDRFKLSARIEGSELPIDLTLEERDLIRKLVNKAYGVLVYGRVCEMTEESTAAKEK